MDGVYAGFAGAKTGQLRDLGLQHSFTHELHNDRKSEDDKRDREDKHD